VRASATRRVGLSPQRGGGAGHLLVLAGGRACQPRGFVAALPTQTAGAAALTAAEAVDGGSASSAHSEFVLRVLPLTFERRCGYSGRAKPW